MSRLLVIGYGNTLCGDDGVGPHVADLLQSEFDKMPVAFISAHQLFPEMAEHISHADAVMFVDARVGNTPGEISKEDIDMPRDETGINTLMHHVTPGLLLSMADTFYGKHPYDARLYTITGEQFEAGDDFSPTVREKLSMFIAMIRQDIRTISSLDM